MARRARVEVHNLAAVSRADRQFADLKTAAETSWHLPARSARVNPPWTKEDSREYAEERKA